MYLLGGHALRQDVRKRQRGLGDSSALEQVQFDALVQLGNPCTRGRAGVKQANPTVTELMKVRGPSVPGFNRSMIWEKLLGMCREYACC